MVYDVDTPARQAGLAATRSSTSRDSEMVGTRAYDAYMTKNAHQTPADNVNCGAYVLYYALRRAKGESREDVLDKAELPLPQTIRRELAEHFAMTYCVRYDHENPYDATNLLQILQLSGYYHPRVSPTQLAPRVHQAQSVSCAHWKIN